MSVLTLILSTSFFSFLAQWNFFYFCIFFYFFLFFDFNFGQFISVVFLLAQGKGSERLKEAAACRSSRQVSCGEAGAHAGMDSKFGSIPASGRGGGRRRRIQFYIGIFFVFLFLLFQGHQTKVFSAIG